MFLLSSAQEGLSADGSALSNEGTPSLSMPQPVRHPNYAILDKLFYCLGNYPWKPFGETLIGQNHCLATISHKLATISNN